MSERRWLYLRDASACAENTRIVDDEPKTAKELISFPGVAHLAERTNPSGTAYRVKSSKGILLDFAIFGPGHKRSGQRVERGNDIHERIQEVKKKGHLSRLISKEWNALALTAEELLNLQNNPILVKRNSDGSLSRR